MGGRFNLALATGAANATGLGQRGIPARAQAARTVADFLRTEDLIAVEAANLLDDIRTALACDPGAATRAARSLASLLAARIPKKHLGPARAADLRHGKSTRSKITLRNISKARC